MKLYQLFRAPELARQYCESNNASAYQGLECYLNRRVNDMRARDLRKFHFHLEQIEVDTGDGKKNSDREEEISQIKISCDR